MGLGHLRRRSAARCGVGDGDRGHAGEGQRTHDPADLTGRSQLQHSGGDQRAVEAGAQTRGKAEKSCGNERCGQR